MTEIYSEPSYLAEHRKIIFNWFNILKKEYEKSVILEAIVNEDESRLSAEFYKARGELYLTVELYGKNKCEVELYIPQDDSLRGFFRGTDKKYLFRKTVIMKELDRYINLCLIMVNVY